MLSLGHVRVRKSRKTLRSSSPHRCVSHCMLKAYSLQWKSNVLSDFSCQRVKLVDRGTSFYSSVLWPSPSLINIVAIVRCIFVEGVGGNQSTERKLSRTQGEHAAHVKSSQRSPTLNFFLPWFFLLCCAVCCLLTQMANSNNQCPALLLKRI